MSARRYGIASAVICSGLLVVPMGAAPPSDSPQQSGTMPAVVAPISPSGAQSTRRPGVPTKVPPPGQRQARVDWDVTGMRGFSVALVIGDLTGASTAPDNLPAGAKKALSDMRDFLPYKSYRLLDTHWILCCSSSQASVAGRLRGSDEDEYSFQIYARPASESAELAITFSLRDVGAAFSGTADQAVTSVLSSADRSRRLSELQELERRYLEARIKSGDNNTEQRKLRAELEDARRRVQEMERASRSRTTPRATRPVLDSTFNMKVGETVVIGTSRLKGDKALIALLTAASRTSTAPR